MASIANYLLRLLSGVPLRWKKLAAYNIYVPMLKFSRLPWGDKFRVVDGFSGISVIGMTGSGKTSASGKYLRHGLLRNHFGGLILTAHKSDLDDWVEACKATGRLDDLVIFSSENGATYNFLGDEYRRGIREPENLVELFVQAAEVVGRYQGHSDESLWLKAMQSMVRNSLSLVILAQSDSLSLRDIHDVISSGPNEEASKPAWQATSACFALIEKARQQVAASDDPDGLLKRELEAVENYWLGHFDTLNPRTKTSIVSVFNSLIDGFLHGEMYRMFSTNTNIDLTHTHRGGLLLMALPTETFGAYAIYAQVLIKLAWQLKTRRRDVTDSSLPTFCYADEFQFFSTSSDISFQGIARQKRACAIYLSQSIPGYHNALGRTETEALLSHLSTKIWHAASEPETANAAADTVGKDWLTRETRSELIFPREPFSGLAPGNRVNIQTSEEWTYLIPPIAFMHLKKGGRENRRRVEAVMFQGGKRWRKTGKNYIKLVFKQRKNPGAYIKTIHTEKGRETQTIQFVLRFIGRVLWFLCRVVWWVVRQLWRILFPLVMWIIRGSRSGRRW